MDPLSSIVATMIIGGLMWIPAINMIVGGIIFGVNGFLIGMVITLVVALYCDK